jgi:hypothetical protein
MARVRTTGGAPPGGATVGHVGATHALPLQPGLAAHSGEIRVKDAGRFLKERGP